MEIGIPFASQPIDLGDQKVKYFKAILSKNSLNYLFLSAENELLHSGIFEPSVQSNLSLNKSIDGSFALNNTHFTLIPREFYKNELHKSYFFDYTNITEKTGSLNYMSEFIDELDLYIVYAISEGLNETISKLANSPLITHYHSHFLKHYLSKKITTAVVAHVHANVLHVVYFKYGQMILSNSQEIHNKSELIYYITLLYYILKLEKSNVKLMLSGETYKYMIYKSDLTHLFGSVDIEERLVLYT